MKIICIAATRWDDMKQRPQHLMRELAKKHEIIYIEPAYDWSRVVKYRKNKGKWPKTFYQPVQGLSVFVPCMPLSIRRYPRLNSKIRKFFFCRQTHTMVKKMHFENAILWMQDIYAIDILDYLPENKLIYDCCDEVAEFSSAYVELARANEDKLIKKASIVFASAQNLYDRIVKQNTNTFLVRNGAEFEHFYRAQEEKSDEFKKKIVGFVGAISDWVNIEMISAAAKGLPDVDFHMVGPVSTDISALKKMENVKFFGKQNYENLSEFYHSFAVGIIPFRINKLTLGVNPIKFYEYCAAGKPVVATSLPELKQYEPNIYCIDTEEEFVAAIDKAIKEHDQSLYDARVDIAKNNSWHARSEAIDKCMKEILRQEINNE
ncbi:MAG: glycosyltransferase [Acidaminococcaceae bacterium]